MKVSGRRRDGSAVVLVLLPELLALPIPPTATNHSSSASSGTDTQHEEGGGESSHVRSYFVGQIQCCNKSFLVSEEPGAIILAPEEGAALALALYRTRASAYLSPLYRISELDL
jgi:hypothetical protein